MNGSPYEDDPGHALLGALIELRRALRILNLNPNEFAISAPLSDRQIIGRIMRDRFKDNFGPRIARASEYNNEPISLLLGFKFRT